MVINNDELQKVSGKGKRVLSSEIASRSTDPHFYAALQVLPNPDKVLRTMSRGQEVFDAIEYDAHVMGELRSIRAGLLAWEWRIQPGGNEPRDIQAFDLCQQVFHKRPDTSTTWSDVIWNIARAVFHGFAVHEVVWTRDNNHFVPQKILDRPHRRFVFDTDKNLRLLTRQNMSPGEELGPFKWLLTRHMMRHDNPYGIAVYSACFWPYTFKHNGYRWFSKFIERYGIPSPVGKYPPHAQQAEIDALIDALSKLLEDRVMAIPEGSEVDLLETKVTGQSIHPGYINLCNREISKALTSQTLATEVQESGSRAVSETHREREEAGQESDREMVAATLCELCESVTELNYPGAASPVFEFYEEANIYKETAETFGLVRRYLDVPKEEAYRRLQIRPPAEGEEVIGPSNPTGPDTPGGADQFSECPSCGQVHAFAAQNDEIERVADDYAVNADQIIQGMLDEVKSMLDDSETFTEFQERLVELRGKLSDSELARQMEQASLLVRLQGLDDGIDDAA